MNLIDLSELGIAFFAIGAMIYLVKKFLCAMKRSEENFSEVVKNHIHENSEASHKLEQSNLQLSMTIKELLSFLKRSNGK